MFDCDTLTLNYGFFFQCAIMFFLAATAVDNYAMCDFSGSSNAKQNDFSNGDQLNF